MNRKTVRELIALTVSFLLVVGITACGGDQEQADDPSAWKDADLTESQPVSESPEVAETTSPPVPAEIVTTPEKPPPAQSVPGWVTAICLNVRSGPGTGSPVVGHVFKGDKLFKFETQGSWHKVQDPGGYVSGWVSAAYISPSPVASDFVIPESYKEPRTPTIIEHPTAKYVGVQACSNAACHARPHSGMALGEYGAWRDHFHSTAYTSLARPYSKALARKRGIEDPTTNWRCLKCHATAYGAPPERLAESYSDAEGVGCEACHGPGSEYLRAHVDPNFDREELAKMGFRRFTDLDEREELCRACHNELSPTYKPFNIEYFSAAIRHWGGEYVIQVADPAKPPQLKIVKSPVQKETPPPSKEDLAPPPRKETDEPAPTKEEAQKGAVAGGGSETPSGGGTDTPSGGGSSSGGDMRLVGLAPTWDLAGQNTKPATTFTHDKHIKQYVIVRNEPETCVVCHHKMQAGSSPTNCSASGCHQFTPAPNLKNRETVFHMLCKGCHLDMGGKAPLACIECHPE